MIRPYTIFCVLLAGASGLFLYSKKHQTNVLDENIRTIVRQTDDVRQQTAMLQSQWALLNQPDRLQKLSARFLTDLTPMAPTQYKRLGTAIAALPAPGSAGPQRDMMVAAASAPSDTMSVQHAAPAPATQTSQAVKAKPTEVMAAAQRDASPHHVVTDKPHLSTRLALATPPMKHEATPAVRAHTDSHVHYATYRGTRAVATPAVAWRPSSGGRLTATKARYRQLGTHNTESTFAMADGALPPPAPRRP
ncbi:hypothetical protein N5W20_02090 [Candidatus Kirkpatrickella diaphorinae]|uniref:ABC transporter permease n=1 Tax=Candidatus Kirkpatrickella diaphorinae TaxID=2984322 RepID=A0ABY6GLH3_9PROT|nr:hypothetical protein [Candidatus Kirkpatrickella diaphorinae]UYH51685.1 hypothetical protein N5W20_02090 [Candidatus Kirkpatrickella diaphorinae]